MNDACGGSMSPDGSLVTMMGSEINGPGAIRFVANADGTGLRHIPGGSSNPAGTWSPDGSRIVCSDGRSPTGPAPRGIRRWPSPRVIVVDVGTGDATTVARGNSAIWLDDHTLLVEA
jgi:hypothetical protein